MRLPSLHLAAASLALVASTAAAQQRGAPVQSAATVSRPVAAPVLIKNATIMTASRGTLENTDLLMRGGKIAAVGQNLTAPAGARTIDATGKYVIPGIIDAHSHSMADAINEGTYSVTSMVRIADVLNPDEPSLYRQLAGGVTTINILHGSANTIGGQNAVVKLKYGRPLEEMMFPGAKPGIKFALGENVKRSNSTVQPGQERRYPATRMGVADVLRDAFTRAKDYQAEWNDYRAAKAAGKNVLAPRRDLELEPLVEILEGKRLVHAHSYVASEIAMLLNVADEFGFKVKTLQHILEGYKVAPEIAKHGAGASTFADMWGYKLEAYDAIPHNAAIMTRAGVVVSINSDSDERARRLNLDAAKTIKYGDMTEQEALRMITLNPAIQLDIQDRVGSIDVGKDADLAIWNGNPLSVYSRVETTFIDGEVFFDREQDLANRAKLAAERAALEQAEPNRPMGGGTGGRGTAAGRPGTPDTTSTPSTGARR
jgi:imidazolonepropionase-like amidohydrolase